MLRRLRWFVLGLTAGVGGSAWLIGQLRRTRERPAPVEIGKAAALGVAELLEAGSRTLKR
jgi:hypothetical protein